MCVASHITEDLDAIADNPVFMHGGKVVLSGYAIDLRILTLNMGFMIFLGIESGTTHGHYLFTMIFSLFLAVISISQLIRVEESSGLI